MSKRAFLGVLWLVACGDDDPAADGQQGAVQCAQLSLDQCGRGNSCQVLTDDAGPPYCGEERIGQRSCEVMRVDECKLDARCQTIDGLPFDEDRTCVDVKQPKGCQTKGTSCPPAIVYARSEGKSYEFASGCVPSGFTRFEPVRRPESTWLSCEQPAGACEAHTADECTKDKRCSAISGRPLDESKQCLGDAQVLSCVPGPIGCTAALVVARDPQGKRWWFSSGCLPAGYTSDTTEGPVNWELCTPLPPETPKACRELSGDVCVGRSDCVVIQGLAYDAARMCVRGQKNVGCMPKGTGCTEFITYARDSEGQTWQFVDGCQPLGFTPFQPQANEQPQSTWTQGCPN